VCCVVSEQYRLAKVCGVENAIYV